MPICLIDQTDHPSLIALHKHLRKLGVKQAQYYVEHYDRRDLLTGEPIPFKTVEQYLSAEFLTKDNLRKWLGANPEEGRAWAIEWLARRRAEKGLTYPPTQVELSSLMCPTMRYYNHIGGYNAICGILGYTLRFGGALSIGDLPPEGYVIDTREQNPLPLKGVRAKLNVGDYALAAPRDVGVYIERKSLEDFIGTLSAGYSRFVREIERAAEVGSYLIILVEHPLADALAFKPKHGAVTMSHVFKNLRDILSSHSHVQALFVKDRSEAMLAVMQLLAAGRSVKGVDVQYLYESGEII